MVNGLHVIIGFISCLDLQHAIRRTKHFIGGNNIQMIRLKMGISVDFFYRYFTDLAKDKTKGTFMLRT